MLECKTNDEPSLLTVSQLNSMAREILEQVFSSVFIEGEISNLSMPSSGHLYFTLKDANAQVRCAMFKQYQRMNKTKLENGMLVRVRARVSLYEGRGDFQLIVQECESAGNGALQKAFEQLKNKLSKQGLFDQSHKKPLPKLPTTIGVITSSTGAALRDILSTLKRRFASIPIIIYPSQVQGELAANQLIKAISLANERNECDVLILARGGGSLEDLWPFNEESVARAIFASSIPIVSGIGHEVDFTISDFVADYRAATPTAAAELVSPDLQEILRKFEVYTQRLSLTMRSKLKHLSLDFQHLTKRLRHPGQQIQEQMQKIDLIEQQLRQAMRLQMQHKHNRFSTLVRALNAISPLNTLSRGYAIASHGEKVLTSTVGIESGDKICVRLHEGQLDCTVDKIQ